MGAAQISTCGRCFLVFISCGAETLLSIHVVIFFAANVFGVARSRVSYLCPCAPPGMARWDWRLAICALHLSGRGRSPADCFQLGLFLLARVSARLVVTFFTGPMVVCVCVCVRVCVHAGAAGLLGPRLVAVSHDPDGAVSH